MPDMLLKLEAERIKLNIAEPAGSSGQVTVIVKMSLGIMRASKSVAVERSTSRLLEMYGTFLYEPQLEATNNVTSIQANEANFVNFFIND